MSWLMLRWLFGLVYFLQSSVFAVLRVEPDQMVRSRSAVCHGSFYGAIRIIDSTAKVSDRIRCRYN